MIDLRFYTRYFPDTNENSCLDIAAYSISNKKFWTDEIEKWQNPILSNKLVLLNEWHIPFMKIGQLSLK